MLRESLMMVRKCSLMSRECSLVWRWCSLADHANDRSSLARSLAITLKDVCPVFSSTTTFTFTSSFWRIGAKMPDPIFGPKGVRLLLLSRGIGGYVSSHFFSFCLFIHRVSSFVLISRTMALFGLYFSLQYLSLSDATVLTFMVPTTTALAAAMFLKEMYTIQQAMCGRKFF